MSENLRGDFLTHCLVGTVAQRPWPVRNRRTEFISRHGRSKPRRPYCKMFYGLARYLPELYRVSCHAQSRYWRPTTWALHKINNVIIWPIANPWCTTGTVARHCVMVRSRHPKRSPKSLKLHISTTEQDISIALPILNGRAPRERKHRPDKIMFSFIYSSSFTIWQKHAEKVIDRTKDLN